MNDIDIVSALTPFIKEYEETAINLAKSRFLVLSTEFGSNDAELQAIDDLASSIRCEIIQEGSSVSLSIKYEETNEYLNVIQQGMNAPLTGGDNGIVTEPDGSTRPSNVPEQLWGHPLSQYAKIGEDVLGEVKTMLTTMFKNYVQDVVSQNKNVIAKYAKEEILKQLKR